MEARFAVVIVGLLLMAGLPGLGAAGTSDGDPPVRCPAHHAGAAGDGGSGRDSSREDPVLLPGAGTYTGCVDGFQVRSAVQTPQLDPWDAYVIPVASGDRVRISFEHEDCFTPNLWLEELQGQDYVTVDSASDLQHRPCDGYVLGAVAGGSGGLQLFRLLVDVRGGERGAYAFTVETGPPGELVSPCDPQDDGGSGADAGFPDRVQLPGPGIFHGCLDGFEADSALTSQRFDGYTVPTTAGELLRVTVTPLACVPIGASLFNSFDTWAAEGSGAHGYPTCDPLILGLQPTLTRATDLTVARSWGELPYTLTVEQGGDLPRVCSEAAIASDTTPGDAEAPAVPRGTTRACMDEFDTMDELKIEVPAGERVKLQLETVTGACWYLETRSGSTPWTHGPLNEVPDCRSSWSWTWPPQAEPSTRYVTLEVNSGRGAYDVTLCGTGDVVGGTCGATEA